MLGLHVLAQTCDVAVGVPTPGKWAEPVSLIFRGVSHFVLFKVRAGVKSLVAGIARKQLQAEVDATVACEVRFVRESFPTVGVLAGKALRLV